MALIRLRRFLFRMGKKHSKEIEAARKIADYYGTELLELDLSKMFEYSSCSLLKQNEDADIPKESYEEQLKDTDGRAGINIWYRLETVFF